MRAPRRPSSTGRGASCCRRPSWRTRGSSGTSSWRGCGTCWRSGISPPGAGCRPNPRGALRMLPNRSHSSSPAVDHVPVMAPEVAELLEPRPGDTVVDCTFGAGGHAAVLEPHLRGSGTYIGIDRDHEAEPFFARFAAGATSQTRFLHGDFALVLRNMVAGGARVQAILMDLGVSSMQIDRPHRGFSYATDAPLDMRMDASADPSAADLVNEEGERELATIFRRYGDERYARQIARAIARRRRQRPFERTSEL